MRQGQGVVASTTASDDGYSYNAATQRSQSTARPRQTRSTMVVKGSKYLESEAFYERAMEYQSDVMVLDKERDGDGGVD